jgi:hypothetical protein
MKSFAEELYDLTIKAQEGKLEELEIPREATPKERADEFLSRLKTGLRASARNKELHAWVLQVEFSKNHYNLLDEYEKLLFDGCKEMGLQTEIKERFLMGDSEGHWIFVKWDKK